jgi:TolA-binding protein
MDAFKSFRVILVIVVASVASYWVGFQAGRNVWESPTVSITSGSVDAPSTAPATTAREFSAPSAAAPVEPTLETIGSDDARRLRELELRRDAAERQLRELQVRERAAREERDIERRRYEAMREAASAGVARSAPSSGPAPAPKPPPEPQAPGNPGPSAGTEGKKE